MLTEITLKDFRCFHEQQTARLAPLTLLVGENSTGKTSFLALIRALWGIAYGDGAADFKVPPYDLGSYEEIAHVNGEEGKAADQIQVGFTTHSNRRASRISTFSFKVKLSMRGTTPTPTSRRLSTSRAWIEQIFPKDDSYAVSVGTKRGEWRLSQDRLFSRGIGDYGAHAWDLSLIEVGIAHRRDDNQQFRPSNGSPSIEKSDLEALSELRRFRNRYPRPNLISPFASAPVRSTPRRTYDPDRSDREPTGDYVPMYLAELAGQDDRQWVTLQRSLEKFGKRAGLFDQIRVRRFDKSASAPFQIQVRKGKSDNKIPWQNLIDVGYGVSQVLPVITELLRPDAPELSLWQQPEVHLHPSAQAALATFFCGLAADGRQLIVETHSDYLIDRVRMDVRDGKIGLGPEDVSILYFERSGFDVQIYPLRIDASGDILDAPPNYRQFFLEEVNRSLGI